MIRNRNILAAVALCVGLLGVARPLRAQFSPGEAGMAGIVGTGSSTIERLPDVLRLQIMISAEGRDAKEALSKLKEKESAAKEKLQKLGADEASVRFADPQPQDANQRRQMEQMIQMRMGGRMQKPSKNAAPAMTLSTTLKAQWPLSAKDADALLVESLELEAKIKAADLPGDKPAPAAVAGPGNKAAELAQEEVNEEAVAFNNNGDGQPNPRDPLFLFVGNVSDEDRDKARAAAFNKARDDAERLATAAGRGLGAIRLLASNAMPNVPSDPFTQMYDNGFQQRYFFNQMNRQQAGGDDAAEAVGPQPGKVGYRVIVYVSFAITGQ